MVLKYTVHGRNAYASGGNKLSAFNAGINELKEGDITEEKLIRAITIADSSMSA